MCRTGDSGDVCDVCVCFAVSVRLMYVCLTVSVCVLVRGVRVCDLCVSYSECACVRVMYVCLTVSVCACAEGSR